MARSGPTGTESAGGATQGAWEDGATRAIEKAVRDAGMRAGIIVVRFFEVVVVLSCFERMTPGWHAPEQTESAVM